jgi:AraC-like DNA-binding protein
MGLISRLAYARARHAGVAMRPLLGKSGLTRQQLEDPKSRIAVRNQVDFLNRVAVALEDDMLGFDLGQAFDLREAGLIYYVFASSPTLQEVFERGARFTAVVNEGVIQRHIDSRYVGLAISYSGVRRHDDRHQLEFWFAALIRIARHLTGTHLRPVRVRLTHQPGRGHARLSRFLGCRVEFGATTDEILFAREARDLRVVNFDPYLGKLLIGICEQALARGARASDSFAARVENVLAPLLPHGEALASTVAARMGLSARTFARRLATEGLTFSALLHRLRLQLARRYLIQEGLPVSKVAWLLGYQEVGAFSHAFRRWTGKAPSEVARTHGRK